MIHWRKSSHSGNNGTCVEIADGQAGQILVRSSTSPHIPPVAFTTAEMLAFFRGVKAGEFDDLVLDAIGNASGSRVGSGPAGPQRRSDSGRR